MFLTNSIYRILYLIGKKACISTIYMYLYSIYTYIFTYLHISLKVLINIDELAARGSFHFKHHEYVRFNSARRHFANDCTHSIILPKSRSLYYLPTVRSPNDRLSLFIQCFNIIICMRKCDYIILK